MLTIITQTLFHLGVLMAISLSQSRFDNSHRRPVVLGADIELGNFLTGVSSAQKKKRESTGAIASRLLLKQIAGHGREVDQLCQCASCQRKRAMGKQDAAYDDYNQNYYSYEGGYSSGYGYGNRSQDWGRKFLPQGSCTYVDLDHLEICVPETTNGWDFVAVYHAMLDIVRDAMHRVNQELPIGQRVEVLANSSDGLGHSFGSHLNFGISRLAWDNLFDRKPHQMLFLAAYQVSSIIFTGQGKVSAENDRPGTPYQISQRADFFECLTGLQTTHRRPIVNTRDEAHCGHSSGESPLDEMARLHCIFYDTTLAHVATLLKVTVMQAVLSMLESGVMDPSLLLDDPLTAVHVWSRDTQFRTKMRTASGEKLTAVEHQCRFFEFADRFREQGGFEGKVPRVDEVFRLWGEVLESLRHRRWEELTGRIDWVLKKSILEQALDTHRNLDWSSPEIKTLDHLYSSLDVTNSLFTQYEKLGLVEKVVSDAEIERFVHEPPTDTRAWGRAQLLRLAEADEVESVNWDTMRFKIRGPHRWPTYPTVSFPNPLGATREELEPILAGVTNLEEALERLSEPKEVFAQESAMNAIENRKDDRL